MFTSSDLKNVLSTMKTETYKLRGYTGNSFDEAWRSLVTKYDILFMGKNYSAVNSLELLGYLKSDYPDLTGEELHSMLPDVCLEMGVNLEIMVKAGTRDFHCYLINLN